VKPFSSESNAEIKLIREIEEFPQHPIVHPFTDYVNTLYVYPVSANFSKYSGTSSARNIAIKVQFLPNTDTFDPHGNSTGAMKAIYGKSSSKAFVSETYVPVNFHNKTPYFHEEIKIALPLNLSRTHHILFSFIHVSCKPKKGKDEEAIIGFAWLPVFDGKIVGNQEHQIPIATELEKNYDMKTTKWMDGKKANFVVKTKLVSSAYAHDEKLHNFLVSIPDCHKPAEEQANLTRIVGDLKQAASAAIVQFCPVIFDELFMILGQSTSSEALSKQAFLAIVEVVTVVNSEKSSASRRDPSLVSYVQYRYCNHPSSKRLIFEEIIKQWCKAIEEGTHTTKKNLEKFAWFFLEITVKRY
jgi:hypothetical protein